MLSLGAITKVATRAFGRGTLVLKHYSPEILTGVGVVGIVVSAVLACKSTLKIEEVLDQHKENVSNIKSSHESIPENYTEKDSNHDLLVVYTRTTVALVKLYALPVGLGTLSIACILGSHQILRKENAALSAAYMALSESFKKYRKRVSEEVGDEREKELLHGLKKQEIEVTDSNGNKTKELAKVVDRPDCSPYARFFDIGNPNWTKNPELNLMFLRSQQNSANDKLRARGHIFLNEVYDMLGLPRTQAGQIVGWVDGHGDSYVDFNIYDIASKEARDFVNGYERSILLDFNVDGEIDKIFLNREYYRKIANERA